MKDRVLHEFDKNSSEVVRCGLSEWKGHDLFYAYVFYRDLVNPKVEPKPTKKGLVIRTELLGELEKAIGKARREIDKTKDWELKKHTKAKQGGLE